MEISRPLRQLTLFALALGLCFASVSPALAIGVSPSTVIVENVLGGSSVPTEIVITRPSGAGEANVALSVGGASGEYVKLPEGETAVFPEGKQKLTIPMLIEPGNLAGGEYEATFTVTMTSNVDGTSESTGTSLMGASQARILFTVTNDAVESYTIESADMLATEVGEPLGFSYFMNNSGNVDTRPARVELSMEDETDSSNNFEHSFEGEEIDIVPAFTREEVTLFIEEHDLVPGLYATSVKFYDKDDELIFEMNTLRVQIFPQGTLSQEAALNNFEIEKPSYLPGESVRMSAEFENTGSIGVEASYVVEVFLNGNRVDELKDEEVFVPAGKKTEFEYDFIATEEGEYTAKAYVKYGIYKTDELSGNFSVALEGSFAMLFALIMVIIGIILALVTFLTSRHSNNKAVPVNTTIDAKSDMPAAPAVAPHVEAVAPIQAPVAAPAPVETPTPTVNPAPTEAQAPEIQAAPEAPSGPDTPTPPSAPQA